MIIDHLKNPEEFWGDHMLPTVARNAAAEIIPARGAMFPAQRVGRQDQMRSQLPASVQ